MPLPDRRATARHRLGLSSLQKGKTRLLSYFLISPIISDASFLLSSSVESSYGKLYNMYAFLSGSSFLYLTIPHLDDLSESKPI